MASHIIIIFPTKQTNKASLFIEEFDEEQIALLKCPFATGIEIERKGRKGRERERTSE
jgi:hypothetical protein